MNTLYAKGLNKFARGDINWLAAGGDTVRAMLVSDGYTPDTATHEFFSDIAAGNRKGNNGGQNRSDMPSLTLIDPAAGVCDANDIIFTAVTAGGTFPYVVLFKDSGADATSPLLFIADGKGRVEIAVDAALNATTLYCEELPGAAANGITFTKISGTGPATFTLSAGAAAGARILSVNAISAGITAGAVYEYAITGSGLPITPNGNDISCPWDNGTNKIFKI